MMVIGMLPFKTSMKTSTSVHHVIQEGVSEPDIINMIDFEFRLKNNHFYGVTAGSFDDEIAPTLLI